MSELSKKVVEYLGYPGLCLDQDRAEKLELAQEVETLAKQLSDVQESKWVSVGERLPETMGYYWTFGTESMVDGYTTQKSVERSYFNGTDFGPQKWSHTAHITHWQPCPMPQPPKPEEKPL